MEGGQSNNNTSSQTMIRPQVEEARVYTVHLRPRPHVSFASDVIDNEHLNRRKSKKCCIFHKKRAFGESSSESDNDEETTVPCKKSKKCTSGGCQSKKE